MVVMMMTIFFGLTCREGEGADAGRDLIKALRKDGWTTPVLVYCSDLMKVLELQVRIPSFGLID